MLSNSDRCVQIHWVNFLNSSVVLCLLWACLVVILIRTARTRPFFSSWLSRADEAEAQKMLLEGELLPCSIRLPRHMPADSLLLAGPGSST